MSKASRPGSNASSGSESRNPDVGSRPRKRRPTQDSVTQRPDVEATPTDYTDYVDYKPVARPDDEPDNSANFDER